MPHKRLSTKKRRLCYVNPDSKILEASAAFLEKRLKMIGNLELEVAPSIEGSSGPCDLFLINASHLSDEMFPQWLQGIAQRVRKQKNLQVPAIIFSRCDFSILNKLWEQVYKMNWYFDIVHPQHIESLPVRVANLLRIHDHIHELQRYEEEVHDLKNQVATIKKRLEEMN